MSVNAHNGVLAPGSAAPQTSSNPAKSTQISMGLSNFASLLAAQGSAVIDPQLALPLTLGNVQSGSGTMTVSGPSGPVGPMPTAAQLATQIVNEVGSNGVVTLQQAEGAMLNASPDTPKNSQANVDADFDQLSGGSGVLTVGQLTSAMQGFMNAGGFSGNGSSGGMIVNGVVTGGTTGFTQTVQDAMSGKYNAQQQKQQTESLLLFPPAGGSSG